MLQVHLDVGGCPVTLSDTAGIRDTVDVVESLGIERTRKRLADADIALLVFDRAAFRATAHVNAMTADFTGGAAQRLVVFNKCDAAGGPPSTLELDYLSAHGLRAADAVWASCNTLEGVDQLLLLLGERAQEL